MQKKKLVLIDGNSYCYRAYYAIRNLSNSKGQPTNAVYGFATMLNKLIKEESPDYLGVAFDMKGPTFRHRMHKEYKIQRKPMPDDLSAQIPIIKDMVRAYGIPVFEKEGYEADDLIATISKKAAARSIETNIVTGDKDILQLVGPHIVVRNTHKEGLVYDEAKVKERFGVGPEGITDIMALMGDQSDNYKGVPGIGEVAACRLIKEFGSLDNLYGNLDKVGRDGWRNILRRHEEDARLSKELATLDTEVPIEVDFEKLKRQEPRAGELAGIFSELEFRSLLKEIAPEDKWDSEYKTVSTRQGFETLLKELKAQDEAAIDVETTGSDPMTAELIGVSFCWKEGEARYVPLKHESEKTLDRDYALGELKSVLEDDRIRKVGQNIKYEKLIFLNCGIELKGIAFDTMIASYLLNPSKLNHNLGDMALEYLGHKMTPITDLIGKGKKAVTMDRVSVEAASRYCCEDSDATLRLKNILAGRLKENGLDSLFYNIEMPLVDVLAAMEFRGVALDEGLFRGMSEEMERAVERSALEICGMCGCDFNVNSPKQLSEVLFEKLGLPALKRTKTGISTDEEVLKKLSLRHRVPAAVLAYRELMKLKTTYVDSLPKKVNPRTGRLHTSFNQTITATGRLSSSQPNLQNIPVKRETGRKIRQGFVPASDKHILLSSDYSQIELRILAHLSGDKRLAEAFGNDRDIHVFTASLINDVPEGKVTGEMRAQAKTVNFGIIYGMSAFGLSKSLGIEPGEAQRFIDAYFERYPDIKIFLDDTVREAREKGYVTTIMNRRRYIPDITSESARLRQFAERTAINTPIQGSAADIIKAAMIDIYGELKKVKKMVKEKMENVVKLKVPVKTNISVGVNWLDLKELE